MLGLDVAKEYPDLLTWAERVKRSVHNYEDADGKGCKVLQEFIKKQTGRTD